MLYTCAIYIYFVWSHFWITHIIYTYTPVGVTAEVTADNASIRVSWQWSCRGLLDFVRVDYQPEGGSLMSYTVDNTTATSATLPNLQCNTEYTIWVHAKGGQINRTSTPRMVSLPARGMYMLRCIFIEFIVVCNTISLITTSTPHSYWCQCSAQECIKCQGNMAVDQFRPSSQLLQYDHCDLPSWGRWWVLPAAQWPSSNWGHSHWPPVQH